MSSIGNIDLDRIFRSGVEYTLKGKGLWFCICVLIIQRLIFAFTLLKPTVFVEAFLKSNLPSINYVTT